LNAAYINAMSIINKIMNKLTKHPNAVTLGIVVAATFIVGAAIGSIDHNVAFASIAGQTFPCPHGCP
jgi:hypothetical protein